MSKKSNLRHVVGIILGLLIIAAATLEMPVPANAATKKTNVTSITRNSKTGETTTVWITRLRLKKAAERDTVKQMKTSSIRKDHETGRHIIEAVTTTVRTTKGSYYQVTKKVTRVSIVR